MGPANYPSGFANGLTVQNVPISIPHPGKVFWVNNSTVLAQGGIGGSNGNDGTYQRPFSTLDYAIGKCTANRGDVIYIMPGHAESLIAADAVDVDIAGVRVIGLGRGTKRAKFTYNHADGEFVIGADNVRIENLWFVPSVTIVTHAIDIETGSDYFEIVGCRFGDRETSGDEFVDAIMITTSLEGQIVANYFDAGEEAAVSAITLTGACNGILIKDNIIIGDYSSANIFAVTPASERVGIMDNVLINGVDSALNTEPVVELITSSSGWMSGNRMAANVPTSLNLMTVFDAGVNLQNLFTDDVGFTTTAVDRSAAMVVSADA